MRRSGCAVVRLTPPGRAALSVVTLVGPERLEVAGRVFVSRSGRPCPFHAEHLYVGSVVMPSTGIAVDEIVAVHAVEGSAFEDGAVELSGHGGVAVSEAVIDALVEAGATAASPTSARRRWGVAESALTRSLRRATRRAGSRAGAGLCSGDAARALDSAIADARRALGPHRAGDLDAGRARLAQALAGSDAARARVTPRTVVLAGPSNVGKSTLFNALVGFDRTITADQPGTTRDRIDEVAVLPGGVAIRLVDTGGLGAGDPLAPAVEVAARAAVAGASLVVWVADPETDGAPWAADDAADVGVIVLNKIDRLGDPAAVDAAVARSAASAGRAPTAISALRGDGVDELRRELASRIAGETPPPGTAATDGIARALRAAIAAIDRGDPERARAILDRLHREREGEHGIKENDR